MYAFPLLCFHSEAAIVIQNNNCTLHAINLIYISVLKDTYTCMYVGVSVCIYFHHLRIYLKFSKTYVFSIFFTFWAHLPIPIECDVPPVHILSSIMATASPSLLLPLRPPVAPYLVQPDIAVNTYSHTLTCTHTHSERESYTLNSTWETNTASRRWLCVSKAAECTAQSSNCRVPRQFSSLPNSKHKRL